MNIDPSGTFLYAANQKTDNIGVFRIDSANGQLHFSTLVNTPTPVDVEFGRLASSRLSEETINHCGSRERAFAQAIVNGEVVPIADPHTLGREPERFDPKPAQPWTWCALRLSQAHSLTEATPFGASVIGAAVQLMILAAFF
jgi:hypothetical protein